MKILHLTQFLGVGGLEKILLLLIQEQISEGHKVELIVYDFDQTWVEYFRSQEIVVHNTFRKKSGYDRKLLNYIEQHLHDVDILHTHDLNPSMYAAPLKFLRKLKGQSYPKLIHTAHGMSHVNERAITKLYERLCSTMSDTIVGVSPAVCQYYIKNLLVPHEKIINIDNGIKVTPLKKNHQTEIRSWLEDKFQVPPQSTIWVCVARVVPLKDQRLLVDAARLRPDVSLLLVGPSGDKDYLDQILSSKTRNVFWLGPQEHIDQILGVSDIFVSASTHEGIPVSVLEAAHAEIPCVLSDIPGHKTLQKNSASPIAVFFETGNIQDFLLKISRLEESADLKSTIVKGLKEKVHKHYSSKEMYHRYHQVYNEVSC